MAKYWPGYLKLIWNSYLEKNFINLNPNINLMTLYYSDFVYTKKLKYE